MATPITIYPNPPIEAGYPTASDPPLTAPQPADLENRYVAQTIREGGFLTAPRSSYSSTPITGVASSTIGLVITLHYSTTFYEVVYQLGAFTPLYLAASTVNLGTGAYSLVRQGGFPPGVTVNAIGCTPCPPMPTNGQALGAIYEVDFRTLPTQSFVATPAAYVVDGLTWWAKGSLTAGGNTLTSGIVNGVGMRFSTLSTYDLPATGDYLHRALYLPLANVPGYNPSAPIIVRAKFVLSSTATSGMVGLVNTTPDAVNYLSAQRSTEVFCGNEQFAGSGSTIRSKYGAGVQNGISSGQPPSPTASFFCGVWEMFPGYRDLCTQIWDGTGAIPAVASIPQRQNLGMLTSSNTNKTVCLTMSCNVGSAQNIAVTHLSICQPRIA